MKNTTHLLIALAAAGSAFAGAPEGPFTSAASDSGDSKFKVSLNARARYEVRNEQGLEDSEAGTLRVRPGFTLGDFNGLSFFAETEHNYAFVDEFNSSPGPDTQPNASGKTAILDPETNEINQFYVDYKTGGFHARVGRQRIILGNAAHIGNVGWRQNEQTYDAATLGYKGDNYSFSYSYVDQVNRIFGSDAQGALGTLEDGDGGHFVNFNYTVSDSLTLGAYSYLLDFDQGAWANSETYGLTAAFKGGFGSLYTEIATQSGHDTAENDGALYGHVKWDKKAGDVTYTFGTEYLEEGFRTPLATVHAFNGFADRFIVNRLGLAAAGWKGQTDVYVGASTKIGGVVVKGFVHGFWEDSLSDMYGWEVDAVLVKKLTDDLTLLGKAAFYFGDNDRNDVFNQDIAQFSVQLDYAF